MPCARTRASGRGAPFHSPYTCLYDGSDAQLVLLYQFPPLKLQIVLWKPVTAEFISKEKEVHLFVNASDIINVKTHLQDSRIQFR